MVDFLKRKLLQVTSNNIVVNLDENKKIQIPYDEYQKVGDLIIQNQKEIVKEQNPKKDKQDISKQFCVIISLKDKRGVIFRRITHKFELIRDLREFNNIDSIEFFIERNHNYYVDERRKTIFLGQKLDQNDKFYLKGPLEKKSSKDGKLKKKQMSLFQNYIQYQSGSKIKVIPLEEIRQVTQSPDTNLKNTFMLITKSKSEGYQLKAESFINMNKWYKRIIYFSQINQYEIFIEILKSNLNVYEINQKYNPQIVGDFNLGIHQNQDIQYILMITSIQQILNYFRDMKLTRNYDEQIESENRKTSTKISSHSNQLLYHLENIVKKPQLVKSIYKNVEKNFVKLQKFDRDLLFQVMSLNEGQQQFEQNFGLLLKYINDQSQESQSFTQFLEQTNITKQFNSLCQQSMLKGSKSIDERLNETVDLNKSLNSTTTGKFQRGSQKTLSSYQSYQSFTNDTIESKLKQIQQPIEKLNYIFISYMTTQYKPIIKFSEMISKILCNHRVENFHYQPKIQIFQPQQDSSERYVPLFKDLALSQEKSQKIFYDDKDITPWF